MVDAQRSPAGASPAAAIRRIDVSGGASVVAASGAGCEGSHARLRAYLDGGSRQNAVRGALPDGAAFWASQGTNAATNRPIARWDFSLVDLSLILERPILGTGTVVGAALDDPRWAPRVPPDPASDLRGGRQAQLSLPTLPLRFGWLWFLVVAASIALGALVLSGLDGIRSQTKVADQVGQMRAMALQIESSALLAGRDPGSAALDSVLAEARLHWDSTRFSVIDALGETAVAPLDESLS